MKLTYVLFLGAKIYILQSVEVTICQVNLELIPHPHQTMPLRFYIMRKIYLHFFLGDTACKLSLSSI
jgi:hypothetical protein